jgi:hypothetical protein
VHGEKGTKIMCRYIALFALTNVESRWSIEEFLKKVKNGDEKVKKLNLRKIHLSFYTFIK